MVMKLNLMPLKIMLIKITVTTNTDTDNDDGEDFFVSLFKSKADYEAGEDIAAHQ